MLCLDPTMRQSPALLTAAQAAVRLRIGVSTVRRWAKDGRLRHTLTPTGRMLFDPADVDAAYQVVEKSA